MPPLPPGSSMATYRRYKEETDFVLSWLSQQTSCRGYKIPEKYAPPKAPATAPAPSRRLKGKERKQANLAKSESIKNAALAVASTNSAMKLPPSILPDQASFLAHFEPPIVVSSQLQRCLKGAIETRERFSNWFTVHDKTVEEKESTKRHKFFTKCLKDVQDVLRPFFQKPAPPKANSIPSRVRTTLENSFQSLEIANQENDDYSEMEEFEETGPRPMNAVKNSESKPRYGIDQPLEDDIPFSVWCYFEDLSRLLEFLKTTWEEQLRGELDFVTAAIVTEVAFDLARKAEEALIALAPQLDEPEFPRYYSISEILYPNGYQGDGGDKAEDKAYSFEAMSLHRDHFRSSHWAPSREPLDLPEDMMSPASVARVTEGDQLISLMMLDLHYQEMSGIARRDDSFFDQGPYAETMSFPRRKQSYLDNPTKAFREAGMNKTTITGAFVVQVVLQINRLLGENISENYLRLRQEGLTANRILGLDWSTLAEQSNRKQALKRLSPDWGSEIAADQALTTRLYIKKAIETNPAGSIKSCFMKQPGHMWDVPCDCCGGKSAAQRKPGRIWPSKDLLFYYNHNPLYCGMESLKLSIAMERTGVLLCQGGAGIAVIAHLYKMIQQKRKDIGGPHWVALEAVIRSYEGQMFLVNYPTSPDEMVKRLLLCVGVKASELVPTARKNKFKDSRFMKFPEIIDVSTISKHLQGYLDCQITGERFLYDISSTQKPSPKKTASQTELLSRMRDVIQSSLPRIRHDYTTLHRQCASLLDRIRRRLKTELGIIFRINGDESKITCVDLGIDIMRLVTGSEVYKTVKDEESIDVASREKLREVLTESFGTFIKESVNQSLGPPTAFDQDYVTSFEVGYTFSGPLNMRCPET
ncbi:hypothetical protein BDZ45DRAFT_761769 [Acephala macrosclerotiorum]|nr:hypothetical protein BDZ45DRAFT_761769 [Acephala macrosclerotiorum]